MIKIAKDVYMETLSTFINDDDKLVNIKKIKKKKKYLFVGIEMSYFVEFSGYIQVVE